MALHVLFVALSEHPAEAPFSILHNSRSQQMLPMVFPSMAEPLTPPVLKECQDEGDPCTSLPRATCSRSASNFSRSKLAVLASHVLKRIRQEAAKSRGPQLQHFLSQMKFPSRACFNGTGDDYIYFFFPAEWNRCGTFVLI